MFSDWICYNSPHRQRMALCKMYPFVFERPKIGVVSLSKHLIFGERLLVSQTQATQTTRGFCVFFLIYFFFCLCCAGFLLLLKFQLPVRLKHLVVAGLSAQPETRRGRERNMGDS